MIEYITTNWVGILAIITSAVTTASLVAKLTPTETDDKIVAKIVSFINFIAINPKK